jgi:hypothetical protein
VSILTRGNSLAGAVNKLRPVSLLNLRRHFRQMYGLNPSQIEMMLDSSAKSLVAALANAQEAVDKADGREQLASIFHGLKGLFLNMGENGWAAFARDMEEKLKTGVPCDPDRAVVDIRRGLADILLYYRDRGKENT